MMPDVCLGNRSPVSRKADEQEADPPRAEALGERLRWVILAGEWWPAYEHEVLRGYWFLPGKNYAVKVHGVGPWLRKPRLGIALGGGLP